MADLGDEAQARDEWEFALRLDPAQQASLRGLGFLAYKRRDLATAEQLLARALHAQSRRRRTGHGAASRALRAPRIGARAAPPAGNGTAPATHLARASAADEARQLFATAARRR